MSVILPWIVGIVIFAIAMHYASQTMKRLALLWQQTAEFVGGTFEPAAGSWWKRTPMKIFAELEGVPVAVDHYTVSHGKSSTPYTRIRADASGPATLSLKVYKEGADKTSLLPRPQSAGRDLAQPRGGAGRTFPVCERGSGAPG